MVTAALLVILFAAVWRVPRLTVQRGVELRAPGAVAALALFLGWALVCASIAGAAVVCAEGWP